MLGMPSFSCHIMYGVRMFRVISPFVLAMSPLLDGVLGGRRATMHDTLPQANGSTPATDALTWV